MKKLLSILTILCLMFALASCTIAESNSESQNGNVTAKLEMSEVLDAYEAEFGERFFIPEVTATFGNKTVEITVTVKTASGEDVELEGRGTRFTVTDVNGYVITFTAVYGEEKIEKTATITIADTTGPKIDFEESVDGLTVKKGDTVAIPVPVWTDASGEVKNATYTLTYNGEPVEVTAGADGAADTFVASEYGDYTVTYYAEDVLGNKTEYSVILSCARMVVLEDFEAMDTVWADPSYGAIVEDNAVEGNALRITGNDDWQMFAVYPPYYDLSGFDKFQITVYSSEDIDTADEGIYLLNSKFTLSKGKNVITISKDEFDAQYPNGKIPSTQKPQYFNAKYLWFQVKTATGVIWVDNFVGIYNSYTEDTAAPVIDFGKAVAFDEIAVNEGDVLVIPTATAYDNSMEEISVSVKVTDNAGEDITESVKAGTVTVVKDEVYSIIYTATDASGNTSTKTVSVEIIVEEEPEPPVDPDDLPEELKNYYPTDRAYDVLQSFDANGCIDIYFFPSSKGITTAKAIDGNAFRINGGADWAKLPIKVQKNGNLLLEEDWKAYEKFKLVIYSANQCTFAILNHVITLNAGYNVVELSSEEMWAQVGSRADCYPLEDPGAGYLWCQVNNVEVDLYFDAFIGIYPEGYTPEENPDQPDNPEIPDAIKNYFPTDRLYDTLQSFDEADCVDTWFFQASEGITATNAIKNNAFRVQGSHDCGKLPVIMLKDGNVLTVEDWGAYESFKLYVYCESAGTFYFLNKGYYLSAGHNVIEISVEDMLAQINSNADCYEARGYFWCQLAGTNVDIYLDELIGIYPEGYEPDEEPELPEAIKNYFPTDRLYDTLQSFDETGCVDTWFFQASEGITATNAVKNNAFRIQGEAAWSKLPIMIKKNGNLLTEEDWKAYESFKLAVYSNGTATFAFLGKVYDLVSGWNVITISSEDMWAQISSNADCYPETGWFWCQLAGGTVDLYFDELIGIYPEGYEPDEEPEVPVEPELPEAIKNYFPTDRLYDTLQSFDDVGCVDTWFFQTSEGITATNAVKNNAFRIQGEAAWSKLPIMIKKNGNLLTEEDWKAYESFKLAVYSNGTATFAFLGKVYDLVSGWNVITISSEDMWAQISSNADCYPETGWFWCQLAGATVDLYFDELIGIYPEGYEPDEEPEIPVEPELPEALRNYYPEGKEYDVLQSFDENTAIDPYSVPDSEGVTTANAVKGNAYRVQKADCSWTILQIVMLKNGNVLTEEDWKAYESFKLIIYSAGTCEFWFLSKGYTVYEGYNVIEISVEDMLAQIASNELCYLASGHFWCQLNGNVDIYLDELIGIYPASENGGVEVPDFENENEL